MALNYLCFTSLEDNNSVKLSKHGSPFSVTIQYSFDQINWNEYTIGTEINFSTNEKIYLKGNNSAGFSKSSSNYYDFSIAKKASCSGNIMSLISDTEEITTIPNNYCFCYLFHKNISLISCPELPATTLTDYCYYYMFSGCTLLKTLPELPATILPNSCYYHMFDGCSSVKLSKTQTDRYSQAYVIPCYESAGSVGSNALTGMFSGTSGMFTGTPTIDTVYYWSKGDKPEYLCFKSNVSSDNISLRKTGNPNPINIFYSFDQNEWTEYVIDTSIRLTTNQCVYFKGNNLSGINKDASNRYNFYTSASTTVSGNVMSLISAEENITTIPCSYCFGCLFYGCRSITGKIELSATTLKSKCYDQMFQYCEKLTTPPDLPADILAESCYQDMFRECTSLTYTPQLNAINLKSNCYSLMFYGCTKLTTICELPATTLAPDCYSYMFGDCTALKNAPQLPAYHLYQGCYMGMFYRCSSLIEAPELPAENVYYPSCYRSMFEGCTSLINAPQLPILKLDSESYMEMFKNCTSLIQSPELPATTLDDECYYGMFRGCTSLQNAPELPATVLYNKCYQNMFYGCSSLSQAPELPATQLANYCYQNMFYECSSLTQAPELPATQLANYCYQNMFYRCSLLTQTPELSATQLATGCYLSMFEGCASLTAPLNLPATILVSNCYEKMFKDCTSIKLSEVKSGNYCKKYTIPCTGSAETAETNSLTDMFVGTGGPFTETPQINVVYYLWGEYEPDYLCITSLEDDNFITLESSWFSASHNIEDYPIEYSINNVNSWQPLLRYIDNIQKNDKIYLRGTNGTAVYTHTENQIGTDSLYLKISKNFNLSGTINTLYNYTEEITELPDDICFGGLFSNNKTLQYVEENFLPSLKVSPFCYWRMFNGCSSLINPPKLPATVLDEYCYGGMFDSCTSLTYMPELPSLQLADGCYYDMFNKCTSLINTSRLSAETLTNECYSFMFADCTSLQHMPELALASLASSCYRGMFFGCVSLQEIQKNIFQHNSLEELCYAQMFSGCQSITSIPDLPATQLAKECYWALFNNCLGLTHINLDLPAIVGVEGCYSNLFSSCKNLVDSPRIHLTHFAKASCSAMLALTSINTIPELDIQEIEDSACYQMFEQCTLLEDASSLSINYTAKDSYYRMFANCTNLLKPPELPALQLADRCYDSMFLNCTNLLKPPELPALQLADRCYYCMFQGCTSIKLSTIKHGNYNIPFRLPSNLNNIIEQMPITTITPAIEYSSVTYMFTNTGGEFVGTPEINTIYYLWNYDSNNDNLIFFGNSKIDKIYFGNSEIEQIFFGNLKIK